MPTTTSSSATGSASPRPASTAKYNGHYNIWIADGASHNTVGTPALADRNVSGGAIKGLALYGPGTDFNTIQNNVFCITPNGLTSECAVGIDFSFGPKHNLIGGTGARERNVFGRTRQNGIEFAHGVDNPGDETWHSDYNQIIDNWIGFRLNGSYDARFRSGYIAPRDAANDSNGINIADGSSYNTAEGNFIGTVYDGINLMWANETGNTLRNNTIGIAPNGDPAPFARYGVNVRNTAHNHTIVGNIISNAGTYGIALVHKDDSSITISQNIITNMTGPAIYMVAGANGSIAPPTISSATTVGVSGKAVPGAKVEVFSASRNAGQSGLPTAYLGSATANASGSWSLAVALTSGARVTATQTGANGNTSTLSTNASVGHGTATTPTADFTSQQQAGTLTVAFADTSTGGPATSWSWDFGDGSTLHPAKSLARLRIRVDVQRQARREQLPRLELVTKSVVVSSGASQPYVSDSFARVRPRAGAVPPPAALTPSPETRPTTASSTARARSLCQVPTPMRRRFCMASPRTMSTSPSASPPITFPRAATSSSTPRPVAFRPANTERASRSTPTARSRSASASSSATRRPASARPSSFPA